MDLSRHKFSDVYDGVDDDDGVTVVAVFETNKFDFYHQLIDYNDAVAAVVVAESAAVAVGSGNFDLTL